MLFLLNTNEITSFVQSHDQNVHIQSWKKVMGHPNFTNINRARVTDMLTVQQRAIHQQKEGFSKFPMSYNMCAKVASTGC